jgi:hypothetical protein
MRSIAMHFMLLAFLAHGVLSIRDCNNVMNGAHCDILEPVSTPFQGPLVRVPACPELSLISLLVHMVEER